MGRDASWPLGRAHDHGHRYALFCARSGMTLIETLLVVTILGTLLGLAVGAYLGHLQRARLAEMMSDLVTISHEIDIYEADLGGYPGKLSDLALGRTAKDPWGQPYRYLPSTAQDWERFRRRDRFLVPLNSDYDLYSVGPDGDTAGPLTAKASHDDFIRAGNGSYVGLACEF